MSIEFEPIQVRPITETPTVNFRYVANSGIISCLYYAESFDPEMHEQVGWIPARATPKPPQPKEGEWWMCDMNVANIVRPLFYSNGEFRTYEKSVGFFREVTPLYKMERAEG